MMIPLTTSGRKSASCLTARCLSDCSRVRNSYKLIEVPPESNGYWGLSPLTAEILTISRVLS